MGCHSKQSSLPMDSFFLYILRVMRNSCPARMTMTFSYEQMAMHSCWERWKRLHFICVTQPNPSPIRLISFFIMLPFTAKTLSPNSLSPSISKAIRSAL